MKKGLLLVLLAVIGVLAWYFLVTKRKPKEEVVKVAEKVQPDTIYFLQGKEAK